jgi:hypothetical protein
VIDGVDWYAMAEAARDGSEVILLVRHASWSHASDADRHIWQAEVRGRWTAHNGGGWTWWGLAGAPIAWRPATVRDPVPIDA